MTKKLLLLLTLAFVPVFSQIGPVRINLPDSTYTAQLRGKTGTRTAGLIVQGTWNGSSSIRSFEFSVTVSGRYDLYVDPAGGTSYAKQSTWGKTLGKIVTGTDFGTLLEKANGNLQWLSIALGDTSISSTKYKNGSISYAKLDNTLQALLTDTSMAGRTYLPDDTSLEYIVTPTDTLIRMKDGGTGWDKADDDLKGIIVKGIADTTALKLVVAKTNDSRFLIGLSATNTKGGGWFVHSDSLYIEGVVAFGSITPGKQWVRQSWLDTHDINVDWTGFENDGSAGDGVRFANLFYVDSVLQCVQYFPGTAYIVNLSATGPIDTRNVVFRGSYATSTAFYPTTDTTLFDIRLNHGIVGNFSINYMAAATKTHPAIRLMSVSQCRFEHIVFLNCYRGMQVRSSYSGISRAGHGPDLTYIWQVEFDHIISQTDLAEVADPSYMIDLDSSSDSTTLLFSNCHCYGNAADVGHPLGHGYGWYFNNCSTVTMNNCSMDYGADVLGSVIYYANGQHININTFHLEAFKQITGGTSVSPFYLAGSINLQDLFTVSYRDSVGSGNTAYLIKTGYPSRILFGNYQALASTIDTLTTFKIGNFAASQSVVILPLTGGNGINAAKAPCDTLWADKFLLANTSKDEAIRTRIMSDIYYQPWAREVGSYILAADDTVQLLLRLPLVTRISGYFYPNGRISVAGSTGPLSFTDELLITSQYNAFDQIKVVASDTTTGDTTSTRTYSFSGDSLMLKMSSRTWRVACNGKLLYPHLYE